ncbi:MAG: prepilin-type N-terminal cleavage/methylation domain-containing protein [Nitrospiraceae bacterium]|nr:prepilin-type N-terminal cleavage/methylation domain-containing protein [Nitrospiraceae bacterium]
MKNVFIKKDGFTLLELLIALVLSMLVLILIGGAMKLGLGSVRSGQRKAGFDERFRTACNILDSQVQDMIVLAPRDAFNYAFRGNSSTMKFASVYSIWGDRRGCVWVKYTIEPGEDKKQVLKAEETDIGPGARKETVLFPSLDSASFEYYVRELKGEQGVWTDRLDADRLGKEVTKIRVNFVYGTRSVHMVIPVNVRDSLNNTSNNT